MRELDPKRLGDHIDRLYRAAWGLTGSREDAEDLVQETFARVLARPRLLRSGEELWYLLRAMRNTFYSQRRGPAGRSPPAPLSEEIERLPAADSAEPHEVAVAREVYAAISALPGDQRDALVAVDVAGLSYREAARALRVREGTVTSRLFRARQRVARALEGERREADAEQG